MPRNFMFTKEEIVQAALDLTRERGASAVTARALGQKLGSSSRPIFSYFSSMSEVQVAVLQAAQQLYQRYLAEDMAAGKYPPYKAGGMAYIRFAKEEKELFRLLFMRDRTQEAKEKTDCRRASSSYRYFAKTNCISVNQARNALSPGDVGICDMESPQ